MKVIIFETTMLVLVVGFAIFLAMDDRKNRRLREEEDRQKAQQKQQSEKTGNND